MFKALVLSVQNFIKAAKHTMGEKKRRSYVADFETTTTPEDCRVWGWGIADIEKAETAWDVEIGTDMDSFIDRVSSMSSIVYFHNLGFDGKFILPALFRMGYTHTEERHPRKGQFTTMISNMGSFYTITVAWVNGKRTEFRDSLKKLPMPAKRVATSFNLPVLKGEIDYHSPRPVGHVITREERGYIVNDVLIIALALKQQFSTGMTALTVGADALAEYKRIIGGPRIFDKMFPVLPQTMDAEIRKAYRGGFTYADPRFQGRITGGGIVYDVNSLYPSVMYDRVLPYDEPEYSPGCPTPTDEYPLYIVSVTFTAKLKPNHIPCIQVKGSSFFLATEYQTEIIEPITMTCTNIDLALWEDHYDMDILRYNGGWLFKGITGVFTTYIDKWMEVKKASTGGMREIAKLHLTSLYGKYATNPDVTGKIPYLDDEGIVKFAMGEEETRDPVYTAMGVFITAYARDVTIRAAQQHYPNFAYADTDSLHLLIDEDPDTLWVDPQELGAWKREYQFDAALFLRAKQYTERVDGEHVTHIAGCPTHISAQLTFDDFFGGRRFEGNLKARSVPGGVVLEDRGFTLQAEAVSI